MKVVIVNGMPTSGKTTFENLCLDKLGSYGYIYSSIDFVKEIAKKCGWDGSKTPQNRKFLSDLKDLLTEWGDVPMKSIEKEIKRIEWEFTSFDMSTDKVVLFVDIREPWEIQKAKENFNARTLIVRRTAIENNELSNHADKEVLNYDYDEEIWNEGTIEDLDKRASYFLNNLLGTDKY